MMRAVRLIAALALAAALFWVVWIAVAAALGGIAWLFVFGDSPWPGWAEPVIMALALSAGIGVGGFAGWSVWRWRRRTGGRV